MYSNRPKRPKKVPMYEEEKNNNKKKIILHTGETREIGMFMFMCR